MGLFPLDNLVPEVEKLVAYVVQKAKNNETHQIGCLAHLENYIERQKGAFTFVQLKTEAYKWFMGK